MPNWRREMSERIDAVGLAAMTDRVREECRKKVEKIVEEWTGRMRIKALLGDWDIRHEDLAPLPHLTWPFYPDVVMEEVERELEARGIRRSLTNRGPGYTWRPHGKPECGGEEWPVPEDAKAVVLKTMAETVGETGLFLVGEKKGGHICLVSAGSWVEAVSTMVRAGVMHTSLAERTAGGVPLSTDPKDYEVFQPEGFRYVTADGLASWYRHKCQQDKEMR